MLDHQYQLPSNHFLKITLNSYQVMKSFIQLEKNSCEAGGILVGRVLDESNNFIIDDVSSPMPTDHRRRNHFYRHPNGHQDFFDKKWGESKNTCFYLGEWHTHPEPSPYPSHIDFQTWRRLLKFPTQNISVLFFIILGTSQMKIWQGTNNNGAIRIELVAASKIDA
ncbi:Mov34/MPN/PAD-1 family protein [Paenibacillus sp. MBLB2552]|uniref:Mov34/MPN/PAD-1 family protein n=1 Tax=Paenibacillus mellifer TaxID=2937794 RepID=A0A9X1XZR0_9BACL|nr:Mov34/MPN/PAD-1 family protein [Paenibacillus mellifer]MCK8488259.1 Mov34/MPN/PAD-1 family protein [Paenibacillus mellifer]